uniref:Uncharacterized protein n=1 Tax=Megaselia scalaris TaxID=36166 RepID=T1H0Q9_MEGSC
MPDKESSSNIEEQALGMASNTIKKVGNQFEMGLPWKDKTLQLQGSRPLAFPRFYVLNENSHTYGPHVDVCFTNLSVAVAPSTSCVSYTESSYVVIQVLDFIRVMHKRRLC